MGLIVPLGPDSAQNALSRAGPGTETERNHPLNAHVQADKRLGLITTLWRQGSSPGQTRSWRAHRSDLSHLSARSRMNCWHSALVIALFGGSFVSRACRASAPLIAGWFTEPVNAFNSASVVHPVETRFRPPPTATRIISNALYSFSPVNLSALPTKVIVIARQHQCWPRPSRGSALRALPVRPQRR